MLAVLLSLLVKSSVIAALGLGLASLPMLRNPCDRVDILRACVVLLIALPILSALIPALTLRLLPAAPAPEAADALLWGAVIEGVAIRTAGATVSVPPLTAFVAMVWMAGVALLAVPFVGGVLTLHRWTREAQPVTSALWTVPLSRIAAARRPELKMSARIGSPVSWGLPPGAILLDPASLARPETARAVMAHELAHLRRRDWLFLILSRGALALFWFSPLVWWLHASLVSRSEDAADAAVLMEVEPAAYARTLVSLAGEAGHPAATGLSGPARSLARRITRIMKTHRPAASRPALIAVVLAGLAAVATPLAALELAPRLADPAAEFARPPAPPAPPALPAFPGLPAMPALQAPPAPPAPRSPPAPPAPPARQVTFADGRVVAWADVDPETRRDIEQARAQAEEARAHAATARAQAAVDRQRALADARAARAEASAYREQALVHAREARATAEVDRAEALAQARVARRHAGQARAEARRQMALARTQMAGGADQMDAGARQMREEAARLRDPAYRARQIEENRERGNEVTDAELQALSRSLPQRAVELEQRARELRERSRNAL